MSTGEGFAEFARKHLRRLERTYAGVCSDGDVDSVHDFRVACRRLNEPLAVLGKVRGSGNTSNLRRKLKRARQALSLARDLDVLLLSLREDTHRLDAKALAHVEGTLTSDRVREMKRARAALQAADPPKLARRCWKQFDDCANNGPLLHLMRPLQAMWVKRMRTALASRPDRGGIDLHEVRIFLKRVRYCTELRALVERCSPVWLGTMRGVQDLLGARCDHLFAAEYTARIACDPGLLYEEPSWSSSILNYARSRVHLADEVQRSFLSAWPNLSELLRSGLQEAKRAEDHSKRKVKPIA